MQSTFNDALHFTRDYVSDFTQTWITFYNSEKLSWTAPSQTKPLKILLHIITSLFKFIGNTKIMLVKEKEKNTLKNVHTCMQVIFFLGLFAKKMIWIPKSKIESGWRCEKKKCLRSNFILCFCLLILLLCDQKEHRIGQNHVK